MYVLMFLGGFNIMQVFFLDNLKMDADVQSVSEIWRSLSL